jgi:hypothetical protein
MRLAGPFDGGIFSVCICEISRAMSGDWAGLNHLDGAIPGLGPESAGVILRTSTGGSGKNGLTLHCRTDQEKPQTDTNPLDGDADAIPDKRNQQRQNDTADSEGDATA